MLTFSTEKVGVVIVQFMNSFAKDSAMLTSRGLLEKHWHRFEGLVVTEICRLGHLLLNFSDI